MTTINAAIQNLETIRAEVLANQAHTDKEAAALLRNFDEVTETIINSMATLREAIVASYKGQIEADRIMVEGTTEPDHEVLPFKSKAAE